MGVDLGTYRARIGAFGATISATFYSIMGASQLLIWAVMACLLLKLSGDVEENPGPPKPLKKPVTIEDWDPDSLKQWLEENGLDKKYCDRMYQEDVDGLAFLWYTKEHLSEDFQMKKGPLQMVLHRQRELQPKEASVQIPPTTQNIQHWLETMHIPDKYIEVFIKAEVDGHSVGLLTEENLSKDFGLTKGPMRKILYSTFGKKTLSTVLSSEYSNQALHTWTTDMVTQWLRSMDFPEKYVTEMNEEEVNGAVLQCYTETDLQHDFDMKIGPSKWLIHIREHCALPSESDSVSFNQDDKSEDLKPRDLKPRVLGPSQENNSTTDNDFIVKGGDKVAVEHSDQVKTMTKETEQTRGQYNESYLVTKAHKKSDPETLDTCNMEHSHSNEDGAHDNLLGKDELLVAHAVSSTNKPAKENNGTDNFVPGNELALLCRGSFGKVRQQTSLASSTERKLDGATLKKDHVPPRELMSLRHNLNIAQMLLPENYHQILYSQMLSQVPITFPGYADPDVPFLPHMGTMIQAIPGYANPDVGTVIHPLGWHSDVDIKLSHPNFNQKEQSSKQKSLETKRQQESQEKVMQELTQTASNTMNTYQEKTIKVKDLKSPAKAGKAQGDTVEQEAPVKETVQDSLKGNTCTAEEGTDQTSTLCKPVNISQQLQDILALPFEQHHPTSNINHAEAEIHLIFSKWGSKENSLEKLMCFCILLQDSYTLSSSSKETLWNNICNSLPSWYQLMDESTKRKFCSQPNEPGILVRVDDSQPVSLRMHQPVMCPLGAKDISAIARRPNIFFVVHQSFLTEEEKSYNICIKPGEDSSRVLLTFSKCCRWHACFDDKAVLTFKSDAFVNSNQLTATCADEENHFNSSGTENTEQTDKVPKDTIDIMEKTSIHMTQSQGQTDESTVPSNVSELAQGTTAIHTLLKEMKLQTQSQERTGVALGSTVKTERGTEESGHSKEKLNKDDTDSPKASDHSKEGSREQLLKEEENRDASDPPISWTDDKDQSVEGEQLRILKQDKTRHETEPPTAVSSNRGQSMERKRQLKKQGTNEHDDKPLIPRATRDRVSDQLLQDEFHHSFLYPQTKIQPVQQEEPRRFDKAVGPCYYRQFKILNVIETGRENLIDPVHEFKEFTEAVNQPTVKQMQKFLYETFRFACGLLNTRNNGTIHFGISDKGKVIGIPVSKKSDFEEHLGHYKQKCFQGTATKAAADCIRPPKFVPVRETSLYVIEIDVVPNIAQCRGQTFLVKLPTFQTDERKPAKIALETKEILFIRDESKTISQKDHKLVEFIQNQIPKLDAERASAEKQVLPVTRQTPTTSLAEKFIRLLCCNQKTLDSSFFPILVVNAPKKELKMSLDSLRENFRFVQDIDWVAVFDFDPDSLVDGLCKLYREKKANQLWDPSTFEGKSDISELISEIQFPELTSWIFCNGRTHAGEDPHDRRDWNRKRSPGVKDAVRFFCRENVVPAGRAIVVFFLLSDEVEPMVEVFFEFHSYLHGVDCLMCVADSDDKFHPWIKEITENHKCDRQEVFDRSVVGMPWPDVQEAVLRMKGLSRESQCFIPTSTGSRRVLKDRDRNMLTDLEILSQNECDSTQIENDDEAFEVFRKKKELQFYKGHKVEWWNFWFTDKHYNQVLKRDKFDDLKEIVYDKLNHEDYERRVGTVTLYHQPGAGGSTLARHVLWHYRKKYRCCVVKKITRNTCSQILKLREFEENSAHDCLPVLVLIEDVDEMEFRDLCAFIESTAARRGIRCASLVCVVLHCKVRETPSAGQSRQTLGPDCVLLDQELSQAECTWFTMKLKSLENDPAGLEMYDPRHMISFMILKENFNTDYVKKTVTGILEGIDKASPEKTLLKYIALLNSYVADSPVAVACCDLLMGVSYFNVRRNHDWEFLLSPAAKLLLLEMQKFSIGSVKAFRIVHPLVSKEVLNQLAGGDSQPLSKIVYEFLRSKLFQTPSFAKGDLVRMTTEMLKRRKKLEYGDDCETAFSPLIQDIIECESYQSAAQVLIEGSTLFAADPILAQQVARVYIKAKDFDNALTFAKKAVDKNPTNSFILDTLGQVYKEQLTSKYMHYVSLDQRLTPADAKEALKLAFHAMHSFRQSQDANEKDYNADNEAGYYGELSVCFKLLDILRQVDEFKGPAGKKKLHQYLTVEDFKPLSVALSWAEYHRSLKALKQGVGKSLEWITDYVTTFKSAPYNNYDNVRHKKMKWHYYEHHNNYRSYFGEEDSIPPPEMTDAEDLNEWRRRRVIAIGGDHFRNIFQLVTKQTTEAKNDLLEIKRLLQQNEPRNHFDLKNLITVNLALSCLDPNIRGIASCQELFEMAKCLVQASQGAQAKGDPYPYYFLSMFLWPRQDMKIDYQNLMFQDALNQLKACYQAREKQREPSPYGMKKMARKWHHRKPMTFFFLSRGKGLQAFTHISKLVSNPASLEKQTPRDGFWDSPMVKGRLLQLRGVLKDRNTLLAENMMMGHRPSIEVQLSIPIELPGVSQEPVTFYLGFSWEGPVAYNVKEFDPHESHEFYHQPVGQRRLQELDQESDDLTWEEERIELEDLKKQRDKLKKKLQSIEDLKSRRRRGEKLEKNQVEKLKEEENITSQLQEITEAIGRHWMEQTNDDFY